MLKQFFKTKRITSVIHDVKKQISSLDIDMNIKNDIIQGMDLTMSLSNSIVSSYNFNRTCKHWLKDQCHFNNECYFKHKIIKFNEKCKYDQDCTHQRCLFLHTGEIWNGDIISRNNNHNHSHNHSNNGSRAISQSQSQSRSQSPRSQRWRIKRKNTTNNNRFAKMMADVEVAHEQFEKALVQNVKAYAITIAYNNDGCQFTNHTN